MSDSRRIPVPKGKPMPEGWRKCDLCNAEYEVMAEPITVYIHDKPVLICLPCKRSFDDTQRRKT